MGNLKVEVFIPEEYLQGLIESLNNRGLLGEGNYDYCYASSKVEGHWRPLDGANPFDGERGKITSKEEIKLEFRIKKERRKEAYDVIILAHPYETPVINFIELL